MFPLGDDLHEECGVVGIHAPGQDAARLAFFALYTLQHRGREAAGIVTSDDALERSLSHADFVVNALPLTTTTKGILNGSLFQQMKSTACLINVGRGEHLVDDDLVTALDSGEIGSAALDVFTQEPLATESPLWGHPKIRITPHVASVTDADDAASILAGEFRALMEGKQPAYLIDKETQY